MNGNSNGEMAASTTLVLITGANQGCGYECAKNMLLSSKDYHVLLGSRDLARGQEAAEDLRKTAGVLGTVEPIQVDVTDDASVDQAAVDVTEKFGRLDVLVNNAGMNPKDPFPRSALRTVLEVNVVGPISMTEAFLPLLRKSPAARIVMVSSSVGSISQAADPQSSYYKQKSNEYRASKSALNMLLVQYFKMLQPEGIKVIGADPGLVATNFVNAQVVRERGGLAPEDGGRTVAEVAKGDRDADVGKVCGRYGVSPW